MLYIRPGAKPLLNHVMAGCRLAFIMGTGDLMAQRYRGLDNLQNVDWLRLSKFASIGLIFVGPTVTHWYRVINPILSMQTAPISVVSRRILNDQMFLAPAVNIGLLSIPGIVKTESRDRVEQHIRGEYASLMTHHYTFWPAVQLFSSVFIHPHLQLIFIGSMAVAWFAYVSELLHKRDPKGPIRRTPSPQEQTIPPNRSQLLRKNTSISHFS